MKRVQLTEESSVWYRLWSNQAAILAAVTTAQALLPFWQGIVPDRYFIIAGAVLPSIAVVLRSIKQPGLKREVKND